MKLSAFLKINAMFFIPFGVLMLVIPQFIFPMIGVDLDLDGLLMGSTVGSMLLSLGLICFLVKNESIYSLGMKAILIGNMTFHFIDSFLTGKGAVLGVMNSFGYVFSLMHLLFALGFVYFFSQSRKLIKE